jgi:hypothetical protein
MLLKRLEELNHQKQQVIAQIMEEEEEEQLVRLGGLEGSARGLTRGNGVRG